MIRLTLNEKFDYTLLETGSLAFGYKVIRLLFNEGTFPGGGECLIAQLDGEMG